MTDESKISSQVLSLLEGTWTGQGRGEYPTVTSFDYRETLAFARRDENSLAYQQQTYKRHDGQTEWLVSHWENGFIRILENGDLELVNAQSGGRGEVLIGTVELRGDLICIHFTSKAITNDPRMIRTSRTFELEGEALRYEVEMQTTAVDWLTHHLKIALHRTK